MRLVMTNIVETQFIGRSVIKLSDSENSQSNDGFDLKKVTSCHIRHKMWPTVTLVTTLSLFDIVT